MYAIFVALINLGGGAEAGRITDSMRTAHPRPANERPVTIHTIVGVVSYHGNIILRSYFPNNKLHGYKSELN